MNEELSLRGSTAHLDPEELATLFEGKLPEEKAARLRQHMAECEECHELFVISAEALEDLKQEGVPEPVLAGSNVHPFRPAAEPEPEQRSGGRLLAFAAMAVLAVLTGFLVHRQISPSAGPELAEILEPVQDVDAKYVRLPRPSERSAGITDQHRLAFGMGVAGVQLALQQRAGDRRAAAETLETMRILWRSLEGVENVPFPFEAGPEAALERLEELRRDNARKSYFARPYLELGLWTEAGRLAAAGGHAEYFQGDFHRETLEGWLGQQVEPDLERELRRIERTGQPKQLQSVFEHLRETYDPS